MARPQKGWSNGVTPSPHWDGRHSTLLHPALVFYCKELGAAPSPPRAVSATVISCPGEAAAEATQESSGLEQPAELPESCWA